MGITPIIPCIGVIFSFMGIAVVRLLLCLFHDYFEGNTNISIAIKYGSTVLHFQNVIHQEILTFVLAKMLMW